MALGAGQPLTQRLVPLLLCLLAAGCSDGHESDPVTQTAAGKAFVGSVHTDRATVWAVGDGADGSARAGRVASLVERGDPARFLYLGDVYPRGTAAEYAAHYDSVYGGLADVTAPTPGNHEWANRATGYDAYWRDAKGVMPPRWYAFRVAGWQILSLNSEAHHGPSSHQVAWLGERVGAGGNCRIALWHRPRWSSGLHGNAPDVAPLWKALRGRARLVVSGHDHDMQQLRRRDGIVQLVAGSGGHERYPVQTGRGDVVWANDTAYGALRMRLRPGLARYAFVRADGAVLHAGRVGCTRPAG